MNRTHSNFTGRCPRSMAQAFGPYTSNELAGMPDGVREFSQWLKWGLVLIACLLAFVNWGL